MKNLAETSKNLINEYEILEKNLQDPQVIANPQLLQQISQKHAELMPMIEQLKSYEKYNKELQELKSLIKTEQNKEMRALYQDEVTTLETVMLKLEKELRSLLKESDPNAKRNAILEIRAGTGGEEAALFAADLFRMYMRFAEANKWPVQILNSNPTGNGGYKEIILGIQGHNVFGTLKWESGVHRVQRIPATESSGRIHTSAASVVVLPEVDDLADIEIKENKIKVDVYRAAGPGGQSVNTTDSAVRITHLPTGIVVTCQDEKSQHKNKARALSVLKSKLYQLEQEKITESTDSQRKAAIKTGDRSAKIRTYNFPQNRVTDHRVKVSWHNLSEILSGNLEEITSETASKLEDEIDI